jgi:hypothetical protein
MIERLDAPLARAASTKSRLRICVVAASDTRQSGGMNTSVRATRLTTIPPPIVPEMATASSTDGNA